MSKFEAKVFSTLNGVLPELFLDYYHDDGNELWEILFEKFPDSEDGAGVEMLWDELVGLGTKVHLYVKEDDMEYMTGFIFESEQDLLAFKLQWL